MKTGFKKKTYFGAEERPPLNMADRLLDRVDRRFDEANLSSIDGLFLRWFRVLRTIKSSIIFKVEESILKAKDEEMKKKAIEVKEELEKEFNSISGKLKNMVANQTKLRSDIFQDDLEKALARLEERLVILSYEYGIYYPKYMAKAWEQELEEEDV